jgi:hypothetical protein
MRAIMHVAYPIARRKKSQNLSKNFEKIGHFLGEPDSIGQPLPAGRIWRHALGFAGEFIKPYQQVVSHGVQFVGCLLLRWRLRRLRSP